MTDLDIRPDNAYLDALDAGNGVLAGGLWRPGSSGVFTVENPATRETLAEVADGNAADARAAVDAAAERLPACRRCRRAPAASCSRRCAS